MPENEDSDKNEKSSMVLVAMFLDAIKAIGNKKRLSKEDFVSTLFSILKYDETVKQLSEPFGKGDKVNVEYIDSTGEVYQYSEKNSSDKPDSPFKAVQINQAASRAIELTTNPVHSVAHSKLSIICRKCNNQGPEGNARAFFGLRPNDNPEITLCTNRIHSSEVLRNMLAHELTHAYDYCVKKMDIAKVEPLACSEIRAAQNGECWKTTKTFFGYAKSNCVREKAKAATCNMFPKQGSAAVDKVFSECYADAKP